MSSKPQPIVVRIPEHDQLLEWRPSSADAPAAELIDLLAQDGHHEQPTELVDGLTGQPIGRDTAASALKDVTVVARTDHTAEALHQLDLFESQAKGILAFEAWSNSSVLRIELRYPGLARADGLPDGRIFLRGRHQLMMFLPASFPDTPPQLTWLTDIFHPNFVPQQQVWPPGFHWERNRSVLALLAALAETVLGIRARTRGPLQFFRKRPLNPEASVWFRRHRKAMARFAQAAHVPLEQRFGALPLSSVDVQWKLLGRLTGGQPLVFLSDRAWEAIPRMRGRVLGWLIGEQGLWRNVRWFYVDSVFPAIPTGFRPKAAVGALIDDSSNSKVLLENGHDGQLMARLRDNALVLSVDQADQIEGHFVKVYSQPQTDSGEPSLAPKIVVRRNKVASLHREEGPAAATDHERPTEQNPRVTSGVLRPLSQMPEICQYCAVGSTQLNDLPACGSCGSPVHARCRARLGGCPDTGCPECPLYSGGRGR